MQAAEAGKWNGLDDKSHCSGPKVTASDLNGKVVLVDCWGINCPPCRALLPSMEQIWKRFKHKPFILLGDHCQKRDDKRIAELVKANGLTYPIYQFCGLAKAPSSGGGIPFLYVVNHRGKVVWHGRSEREAVEAVVNALGEIGAPPSLCSGVSLKKYKALEKQLVLGKPVKNIISKLEGDIRRADSKMASVAVKEQAEEAKKILDAIKEGKENAKEEIAALVDTNPPEALKFMKAYMASFPEESADYKAQIPELTKKAKEFEAEQKKAASEQKK